MCGFPPTARSLDDGHEPLLPLLLAQIIGPDVYSNAAANGPAGTRLLGQRGVAGARSPDRGGVWRQLRDVTDVTDVTTIYRSWSLVSYVAYST